MEEILSLLQSTTAYILQQWSNGIVPLLRMAAAPPPGSSITVPPLKRMSSFAKPRFRVGSDRVLAAERARARAPSARWRERSSAGECATAGRWCGTSGRGAHHIGRATHRLSRLLPCRPEAPLRVTRRAEDVRGRGRGGASGVGEPEVWRQRVGMGRGSAPRWCVPRLGGGWRQPA